MELEALAKASVNNISRLPEEYLSRSCKISHLQADSRYVQLAALFISCAQTWPKP